MPSRELGLYESLAHGLHEDPACALTAQPPISHLISGSVHTKIRKSFIRNSKDAKNERMFKDYRENFARSSLSSPCRLCDTEIEVRPGGDFARGICASALTLRDATAT